MASITSPEGNSVRVIATLITFSASGNDSSVGCTDDLHIETIIIHVYTCT